MATENLYGERKKKKNPYDVYNTPTQRTQSTLQTNGWSAGQSMPRTQSAQQNSGWNTGQSAALTQNVPQSNAVQKPKREKSLSELGEEVVRTMLEDFKEEERQKQAAFDRAAQYNGGATKARAAAGNRKTAQYGNAAAQLGGQPSYSSPSVSKPAVGNQKAAPYGGAATAQYSNPAAAAKTATAYNAASYASPAAAKPTVKKREMTPSELGEAAAAWMLVDEGIMDPKVLEEYLASFEEPVEEPSKEPPARTFTASVGRSDMIGSDTYAAPHIAPAGNLSSAAETVGEDADPTQDMPEWLALMLKQDSNYPGLTEFTNLVGSELKDKIEQFTSDQVNQLALDWLPLLSSSDSDYSGLAAAANQVGFEIKDKIEQLTPDQVNQLALDWLPLLSSTDSDYPGLTEFANLAGFEAEQIAKDSYLAPGASPLAYTGENFLSGVWNAAEDGWNGFMDYALPFANAALDQQMGENEQLAIMLGGDFRQHADLQNAQLQEVRAGLPEAVETLRRYDAEAYQQSILDRYDPHGAYIPLGEISSGTGNGVFQMLLGAVNPSAAVAHQFFSSSGNMAQAGREAGASDELALLSGAASGTLNVLNNKFYGGLPFLGDSFADDLAMKLASTNRGRAILKGIFNIGGEGLEEGVGTIEDALISKLWNGDDRGIWQTIKETAPEAAHAALIGSATSGILSPFSIISEYRDARIVDAALDIMNSGGTPSDAQLSDAINAMNRLTGDGNNSWSGLPFEDWSSTVSRYRAGQFFPLPGLDGGAAPFDPSNLAQLPAGDGSALFDERNSPGRDNTLPAQNAEKGVDTQEQQIEIQDAERNEGNRPITQESDEPTPESEALPKEEKGDMLSAQEKSALGKAAALIPRIPSSLLDPELHGKLRTACRRILRFAADIPRDAEVTMLYHMDMTPIPIEEGGTVVGEPGAGRVTYIAPGEDFISLHNHSDGRTFSEEDIKSFLKNKNYRIMVAVGHNGKVYVLEKHDGFNYAAALDFYENALAQYPNRTESAETYIAWMEEIMIKGVEQYGASYYSR